MSAALHKLAAEVELATPERERWVVQTDRQGDGVAAEIKARAEELQSTARLELKD